MIDAKELLILIRKKLHVELSNGKTVGNYLISNQIGDIKLPKEVCVVSQKLYEEIEEALPAEYRYMDNELGDLGFINIALGPIAYGPEATRPIVFVDLL